MAGPLHGVRVVEFANLAPVPLAGMLLADLGAEVVRVDRPGGSGRVVLGRSQRSICLDLKSSGGRDVAQRLAARADVVLEGFRPGVMERLGLGPAELGGANPGLVYARLTGWGQDGELAARAGHDINYIAMAGVLEQIGPADRPPVLPLNLVGDFAGGSMFCVVGVLAALHERERSGQGQVVDVAMVDGAGLLMTWVHEMLHTGRWRPERSTNFLDGAAPQYTTYETSDGLFVSVGALEPQFWSELLRVLELDPETLPSREDRECWPHLRATLAERFRTRTRAEWERAFDGLDACVFPVLAPDEVDSYARRMGRPTAVDVAGLSLPMPGPRLSRTPLDVPTAAPNAGQDAPEVLGNLGFNLREIVALLEAGDVVFRP